ncbi:uncharacterized protein PG998_010478 [Apiospora kogelbergensis]|uniref:uncharacterized protein n=1 Tax=Apiospora kogelbergensis TaxID=1337665 RepID=UPI00312E0D66
MDRCNRYIARTHSDPLPVLLQDELLTYLTIEWHAVPLYQTILMTVAQVSVCAFLGKEMARNRRWVELNSLYTTVGIGAVMALRPWPRFLLPIVCRFHPSVKATQAVLAEARQVMNSVLQKRQAETGKRDQDSLDWFNEVAAYRRETFDPAVAQLTFGVASMHSTSDELSQVLVDLRDQPDVVEEMRKELIDAVTRLGWTHAALNQLKLMDSVLKETQRLKPINRVFNKRAVLKDMALSHDIYLPKGAFIAVSSDRTRDPDVYEDPETYDAHRYIKRAQSQPETARFCGFSSVSLESTGFGFGKHACPGRSYVTQELKILLAHIILKYDWKFAPGYEPRYMNNGFDSMTDVTASVLVKRRVSEIAFPS